MTKRVKLDDGMKWPGADKEFLEAVRYRYHLDLRFGLCEIGMPYLKETKLLTMLFADISNYFDRRRESTDTGTLYILYPELDGLPDERLTKITQLTANYDRRFLSTLDYVMSWFSTLGIFNDFLGDQAYFLYGPDQYTVTKYEDTIFRGLVNNLFEFIKERISHYKNEIHDIKDLFDNICLFSNEEIVYQIDKLSSNKAFSYKCLMKVAKSISKLNMTSTELITQYTFLGYPGRVFSSERDLKGLFHLVHEEILKLTPIIKLRSSAEAKIIQSIIDDIATLTGNSALHERGILMLSSKTRIITNDSEAPSRDLGKPIKTKKGNEIVKHLKGIIHKFNKENDPVDVSYWLTTLFMGAEKLSFETIRKS